MSIIVIDPTTALAIRAAIDGPNGGRGEAVIVAAMAPFASGNITVEVLDGAGTLLHTTVRGAWTSDTAGAVKRMLAGTVVSQTNHANGVPATARIKTAGGTVIFQMTAGLANDDLTFLAPVDTGVRVDSGPLVLTAPEGLDTAVNEPGPAARMYMSEETQAELTAAALAGHADWVGLRAWCIANTGTELISNFAGSAEAIFIGNMALGYFIGSAIGDPLADTWAAEAIRMYERKPYFPVPNNANSFVGMRYLYPGTFSAALRTSPLPSGTFPQGATIRGRTSGATAKLIAMNWLAAAAARGTVPNQGELVGGTGAGACMAIEDIVGRFTAGETIEVVGNTSSTCVFDALIRPLALADSGYGTRNYVTAFAMLLEWCGDYPLMTTEKKAEIAYFIDRMWAQADGTAVPGYVAYNWPVGIGNYSFGHMLFKTVAGLAVRNYYPERYTQALAELRTITAFLRDVVKSSGWICEGPSYGPGMVQALAQAVLALKTMTTEDVTEFDAFLRNAAAAGTLAVTRTANALFDEGFLPTFPFKMGTSSFLVLQRLFGTGSLQSKQVAAMVAVNPPSFSGIEPINHWTRFLMRSTGETYTNADLPLSMGLGPLLARAGFATNDTFVWMSAGPYHNNIGYQRYDQGSLRIARDKPLLVTTEYNRKGDWVAGNYGHWPYQNYCTIHGRTSTTDIQQRSFNIGRDTPSTANPFPANFKKLTAEYGLSHFEDISTAVVGRVPYRTAYYRNATHTAGPGVDRIARSVMFVRPGLVFVLDAFTQDESEPASYIQTNWHFVLEAGMPATANSNRDVTVTNSPSRLWGHMSYPTTPAVNEVEFRDAATEFPASGYQRNSYRWRAEPSSVTRNQFFFHVFRAADVAGYSAPTFTDFTATSVFGCMVTGLESSEGTQVCGVFVDNGTDTPPVSVSYSVAQTGACYHYVAGLKKNTSYTIAESVAAGTATVTITEGAGSSTGVGGILRFEVA